MKKIIWLLYILVVVYNAVDVKQTYMLFQVGAIESNPIMAFFCDMIGISGIIAFKTVFIMALGVLLYFYQKGSIKWLMKNLSLTLKIDRLK